MVLLHFRPDLISTYFFSTTEINIAEVEALKLTESNIIEQSFLES